MIRYNDYMAMKASSRPRKTPLYGKKIERPVSTDEKVVKKVTNWLFFWLVAGISITKDLLDLVFGLL